MFAPVSLPHGTVTTAFNCGGRHSDATGEVRFTLRRNEPQQANVDLAEMATTRSNTGFEFVSAQSVLNETVDNRKFNYYIVAQVNAVNEVFTCPECLVGFCNVGYIPPN